MTGITQTIPNYYGGISEQPDFKKNLGQVRDVTNAIPDITYGLYKRPGSKRIDTSVISDGDRSHSTNSGELRSVTTGNVKWFHYYRDENEGSYLGQITSAGNVKVWRCSDGRLMDTVWGSSNGATQTSLQAYLSDTGSSPRDNLDVLTINDTTFVANKTHPVEDADTTATRPHTYSAFVELLKTENGRQYALNINDSNTQRDYYTATRLEISSVDSDLDAGKPGTGHCPGIGTKVYHESKGDADGTPNDGVNLVFRITVRGQQGQSTTYDVSSDDGATTNNTQDYGCTYSYEVTLLHGGRGWQTGNTKTVTLNGYSFTVRVAEDERVYGQFDLNSVNNAGRIRPMPTPFDSDTAVTASAILGGIRSEISQISKRVVGNGIYLYSNSINFNVQVVENDLMKVITNEANDVSELPTQCVHGYIVKINNSSESNEDDYYLRFETPTGDDGSGTWVECPAPGIPKRFDYSTMPVTIQRTSSTSFTVDRPTWTERTVGDDTTNPYPSFCGVNAAAGKKINKILLWRNRLVFLSGENVICSQPGDLYNFWNTTALAVSPQDRIDIACSSSFPSLLEEGIQINNGLLIYSTDQQFLLTTDDSVLSPDTAKLTSISTYNYNKKVPPISLGKTVGFLDSSGSYSKFFESANIASVGEPDIVNQTKVVPKLIIKDIDTIANSRENGIVLFGKSDTNTVFGYKYINIGNERIQSSWFKWKLVNPIRYHFIIGDEYYFIDDKNFLQKINLVPSDDDASITENSVEFSTHLDNFIQISGGSYSSTTRKTTWTSLDWLDYSTSNGDLALSDDNWRYFAKPTVDGTTLTVDGEWTGTVYAGYLFDYQVDFPRFYVSKKEGDFTVGDVNSSLVLHRMKVSFGNIGTYESTLTRVGKDDFTDEYESTPADSYLASKVPLLTEDIRTIPVYEKNTNIDLTIKSTHPGPATIRSISFEGDYSPMYYKAI